MTEYFHPDDVVWVPGVYGPISEADYDIDDKSIGDIAFEELRQEQGLPAITEKAVPVDHRRGSVVGYAVGAFLAVFDALDWLHRRFNKWKGGRT